MVSAILRVRCPDRKGIIAALSDFVFRHGGNILDLDQHSEADTGRFFMRLVWSLEHFTLDAEGIRLALQVLARSFGLHWELNFDDRRDRVAVFCSKQPHCLYDLLLRQRLGELAGDVVLVVSNHPDARPAAEYFGLPFEVVPVAADNKAEAEARQQALLEQHQIDLVVLARYMQILSPDFVGRWSGRVINIHHSFLPAFAGARPYHQAQARGVKLIGATAHYATADLDEGPIIEQDVTRVTHRDTVDDMVRKGRDLERQVLARAVRLHLDRRVLIEGTRTIVFG
jgi:formyltetrahydrofolate deformylase